VTTQIPEQAEQRRRLKAWRRALPAATISHRSDRINRRLWHLPVLARSKIIAAYLPAGGEVDCWLAIRSAWQRGREVVVPVLSGPRLCFAPLRADSPLKPNRYGIPEPVCAPEELLRPHDLDVVLLPLLGFDGCGNRLGMGAGFYDRSFSFLLRRTAWDRPKLIGLAFSEQRLPALSAQYWDVSLDAVVTENECLMLASRSTRQRRASHS